MRLLKYITLLLLVALSFNVEAQEKQGEDARAAYLKKLNSVSDFEVFHIEYRHGEQAEAKDYKRSIEETYIYTFASENDAIQMLHGFQSSATVQSFLNDKGKQLYKNMYCIADETVNQVVILDTLKSDKLIYRFALRRSEFQDVQAVIIFHNNKYSVGDRDIKSFILRKVGNKDRKRYSEVEEGQVNEIHDLDEASFPLPERFYVFKFDHKLVSQVDISATGRTTPIPPRPAEQPGILPMQRVDTFKLSFKIKPNNRIVAQPIWYDRVDIADANCDTVFAFGTAAYLDCADYALTQDRNMDYNMSNDKLYSYQNEVKKKRFNAARLDTIWGVVSNRLMSDSVSLSDNDTLHPFIGNSKRFSKNAWAKLLKNGEKKDNDSLRNIYADFLVTDNAPISKEIVSYLILDSLYTDIELAESLDKVVVRIRGELRGHDNSPSHPYPQGVRLIVEDYNTILLCDSVKDNGERRSPWKFLDFAAEEFLPSNPLDFKEEMKTDTFSVPGELKLFYESGRSVLNREDSINKAEIEKFTNTYEELILFNPSNSLDKIKITGQSSPEGGYALNLNLARSRALDARNVIRSVAKQGTFEKDVYTVAPWDSVVSLLRADGKDEIADNMQSIIEQNPGRNAEDAINKQGAVIRRQSYYADLKPYLAQLRTVFYEYKIKQFGDMPADMIIEKYNKGGIDSIGDFKRGEFWVLMEELRKNEASIDERLRIAELAYNKTRKGTDHWAYAAIQLAACNIAKGRYDLSILDEFLKMERLKPVMKDTFTVYPGGQYEESTPISKKLNIASLFKKDVDNTYRGEFKFYIPRSDSLVRTFVISELDYNKLVRGWNKSDSIVGIHTIDSIEGCLEFKKDDFDDSQYEMYYIYQKPDTRVYYQAGGYDLNNKPIRDEDTNYILEYINQPEVAANQLVMTLKNPDEYWSKYLHELQAIANSGGKRFETLVALASCYNERYTEGQRKIVEQTSIKNKVVINLHADNPNDRNSVELNVAYEASKLLPDTCAESNYLRSIICNRKEFVKTIEESEEGVNFLDSASYFLAKSFLEDTRMIFTSSNDYDLLNEKGYDVVDGALTKWEAMRLQMMDSTANRTIDELAFLNYKDFINNAVREPDAARLAIYKAIALDADYYDIVCVKMKCVQKKGEKSLNNERLFQRMKDIKLSFDGIRANLDAGKPAGNALYEQALREVQDLRRDLK